MLAEMTAATEIPEPAKVRGETTLYGEVQRVGGATPKVQFRSIDGDLIYCDATRELTREAAVRLYEQVGLRGEAEWDLKTLRVTSFTIEEILSFEDVGVPSAFAELREIVGRYFDEISDVDAFVEQLRSVDR